MPTIVLRSHRFRLAWSLLLAVALVARIAAPAAGAWCEAMTAPPNASAAGGHDAHGGSHAHHGHDEPASERDRAPVNAGMHCALAASCAGVEVAATAHGTDDTPPVPARPAMVRATSAPALAAAAPEPPPPRAQA